MTYYCQIQSQLQISQPIHPIFEEPLGKLSIYENVKDRLLSIATRIPTLQASANALLSQNYHTINHNALCELIESAQYLDRGLQSWTKELPATWTYTAIVYAMVLTPPPDHLSHIFFPHQVHRYLNHYIANTWNMYRVYRIIVHSILCRLSFCSRSADGIRSSSARKARCLVTAICASVPFLLGYDIPSLKRLPLQSAQCTSRQAGEQLWPQSFLIPLKPGESPRKSSLVWPLHVASSVGSVPSAQQRWMRAQLEWVANQGEPHLQSILNTESQILQGGIESFRFDCL